MCWPPRSAQNSNLLISIPHKNIFLPGEFYRKSEGESNPFPPKIETISKQTFLRFFQSSMAELKTRQSTSQQEAEALRRQVRAAEAAKAELSEFEVEFNTGSCKNECLTAQVHTCTNIICSP